MSDDSHLSERQERISLEISRGVGVPRAAAQKRKQPWGSVALAGGVGIIAIVAASRFERKPPPPPPQSTTVAVTGSAVAITNGAPQWDVIRLGRADAANEHWTDPVPAYVRVDETKAARVGAPLGGRVSKVFAELGQPVSVGTPLFSVASPDLAALRADEEHAKVDLAAARSTYDRVHAIVQARALPEK